MRTARVPAQGLLKALLLIAVWFSAPCDAGTSSATVDLGEQRANVEQRLGAVLRAWSPSHCPGQRVELRRRGSLWLKLIYGTDDRVHAAGVFRLAPPSRHGAQAQRLMVLRWPGLAAGSGVLLAYPAARNWRPLIWSIGAKQWIWLEESVNPSDPPGRSRYLGGVVVNDDSGFAFGAGFPYDIADALTAGGLTGSDWAQAEMFRPMLTWRGRTPPNVYIEALTATAAPMPTCDSLTLALPNHTDFTP